MLFSDTARNAARAPGRRTGSMLTLWLAVSALAVLALPPSATATGGGGIDSIEREIGNARERAIADYWTERRMRRAEPLDVSPRSAGAPTAGAPMAGGAEPAYVPPLAPGGGPVPKWHTGTPRGKRTPLNHPAAFESGPVLDYLSPPNTTNGKLYGRMPGFGPYECSATTVTAPNRSLIFTAGHCITEGPTQFATRIVFIPSYSEGDEPFGRWVGRELYAPRAWVRMENFNFDFGAIVLNPQSGAAVEDVVGARGLATSQPREQTYTSFGYPGNRLKAQRMWSCRSGFEGTDPRPIGHGPVPSAIGCDMGVGASGGGWIIQDDYLTSVNSFGYPGHKGILYGPYLKAKARQLVEQAGGA